MVRAGSARSTAETERRDPGFPNAKRNESRACTEPPFARGSQGEGPRHPAVAAYTRCQPSIDKTRDRYYNKIMNRQAIIDLYIENLTPLRAYAYSVVHNADDADDVVQELAVQIIKAMDAGTEIRSPKSFLYRCTRNLAISLLRKRHDAPTSDEVLETVGRYEETGFERAEIDLALEQYVRAWSPEMKEAFIRHYFEYEPLKEIAKDLGIEETTLRTRFLRMRRQIPKSAFLSLMIQAFFKL